MLRRDEALELVAAHLGASARAAHSRFVGAAMRRLAERLGADAELWEVLGLVHDLDDEVTGDDRSRHGRVVARWLAGRLPAEGLAAIEAHDHRTGVVSDTPVADALKLSDALAVICDATGPAAPELLRSTGLAEAPALASRPYLVPLLQRAADRLGVPLPALAGIAAEAAAQLAAEGGTGVWLRRRPNPPPRRPTPVRADVMTGAVFLAPIAPMLLNRLIVGIEARRRVCVRRPNRGARPGCRRARIPLPWTSPAWHKDQIDA